VNSTGDGSTLSRIERGLRSVGERLFETNPALREPLLVARDRYARARVRARATRNALRHAAPPEPYRLVRVDPDRVEFRRPFAGAKYTQAARIAGGDWDRTDARFEYLDVYRAHEAHFVEGVPWTETAFYRRVVERIDAGRTMWNCSTEAEFRRRCERLDELYGIIEREGYRSQAEILGDDAVDPIDLGRRSTLLTERMKDEIAIHVGRDGEPLFADGRNRLSIAKILDLDSVPVRVLVRHRGWQAVRDAYARGEPWAAEYDGHPDLAALSYGEADGPSRPGDDGTAMGLSSGLE